MSWIKGRRLIPFIIGVVLIFITPWLMLCPDALAEMTHIPEKVINCSAVVTFWLGLICLVASNAHEKDEV